MRELHTATQGACTMSIGALSGNDIEMRLRWPSALAAGRVSVRC